MADVVVTISISDVSYTTWLRTSIVGLSTVGANNFPMIEEFELGTDQEDVFNNFIDEACLEVLKIFVHRQGDVNGTPFEKTSSQVVYRFNEETPVLPQATSIKSALYEDVKNAIYTFMTILWFKIKNKEEMVKFLTDRYDNLTRNIDNHLYRLHD